MRVPANIVAHLVDGKSRRVLCKLNRSNERQCALLPHGNGIFVISVNKKIRDTLGLTFGMDVEVTLKKDTSVYGLPMPEELRELFRQDTDGAKVFHALTRGRQRVLLYIIGAAKNVDKRIAYSIIIVHHLKLNNGKINHKQLSSQLRGRGTFQ